MKASQCLLIETVGELSLHLFYLACARVVPQGPRHLLVGHGLAIALPLAPQLCQALLVFRGELERARGGLKPPDAAPHRWSLEHLK